jgi:hypothetical protein
VKKSLLTVSAILIGVVAALIIYRALERTSSVYTIRSQSEGQRVVDIDVQFVITVFGSKRFDNKHVIAENCDPYTRATLEGSRVAIQRFLKGDSP